MARILVLDDVEAVRVVLVEFLELEGHECMQAANELEARLLLQENSIEVVISDLDMLVKSGMDLLRYASRHHPSMIFIVTTAVHDPAAMNAAMQMGTRECMVKPFNLSELLEKVNVALQNRRQSCITFPSHLYQSCTI